MEDPLFSTSVSAGQWLLGLLSAFGLEEGILNVDGADGEDRILSPSRTGSGAP
jgi:hypothetical protein